VAPFANRITRLFGIDYPIVQAGMVWASGWKLASAVSNAGGLGLIGSGSMTPDVLEEHIRRCRSATSRPFGVNIPLIHRDVEQQINVVISHKVKIVFTSAGNPMAWTSVLKKEGLTVVHVVGSTTFAQKAEEAGCDAIVAEGFEAGGHNGREETTTLILTPSVCRNVKIPVISAGGIATGRQMLATMILGAEGVQIGSRFVASFEASSNERFKRAVVDAKEGDTMLTLKQLVPVRVMKNGFFKKVQAAEYRGAQTEELRQLLGKGRARLGMFEGDLDEGELEIGQSSVLINEVLPASAIVAQVWNEFLDALSEPLNNM